MCGQVVRIECAWKGQPPFPKQNGNYHHALLEGPVRSDIKPLDIVQPEGPSFTVRRSSFCVFRLSTCASANTLCPKQTASASSPQECSDCKVKLKLFLYGSNV